MNECGTICVILSWRLTFAKYNTKHFVLFVPQSIYMYIYKYCAWISCDYLKNPPIFKWWKNTVHKICFSTAVFRLKWNYICELIYMPLVTNFSCMCCNGSPLFQHQRFSIPFSWISSTLSSFVECVCVWWKLVVHIEYSLSIKSNYLTRWLFPALSFVSHFFCDSLKRILWHE